jgi:hypothetical protein
MNPELDSRYGERLMRVYRVTELPMLVLAFVYVPVFVVGYRRDVPDDVSDAARVVSLCIIAAFAVEPVVKVAVARGRLAGVTARRAEPETQRRRSTLDQGSRRQGPTIPCAIKETRASGLLCFSVYAVDPEKDES